MCFCVFIDFDGGLMWKVKFNIFSWITKNKVTIIDVITIGHGEMFSWGIHCREEVLSVFNLKG